MHYLKGSGFLYYFFATNFISEFNISYGMYSKSRTILYTYINDFSIYYFCLPIL